jgi:tetratricopeptide (TPR) repeat protein
MNSLAGILSRQGKLEEAEPLFRKAWEVRRQVRGEDHPETLYAKQNLASLLDDLDRLPEAEVLMRQVLDESERLLGYQHSNTLTAQMNLASILEKRDAFSEAEALYNKALESAAETLPDDNLDWAWYRLRYGRFLLNTNRYAEAEKQLIDSFAQYEAAYGVSHKDTRDALALLVELYEACGEPEEAARLRKKLNAQDTEAAN